MKAIQKKLLLASVAVGVMTPFFGGGGAVVHAEEVTVRPTEPSDNTVEVNEKDYTINGEKTEIGEDDTYYEVYGGYSRYENVTGNTLTINGGTFIVVWGGYSTDSGDVTGNILTINDGTFTDVSGGASDSGDVTGNILTINGGTFYEVYGGGSVFGDITGNTVNINGGTFNNSVYCDHSYLGNIIGNIMNIYNSPDLSASYISGGIVFFSEDGTSSGNALNIYTKNLTAQNVDYFQNMNFYLDSNISNGDTILTLTSTNGTDVSSADIQAVMQSGSPLTNGDTVTLLTNASGVTAAKSYTGTAAEGVSLTYPLTVYRNDAGTAILARLGSTSGTDTSGTDSSGTDTSGTDTSGTDSSGTDTSDTDSSGTDSSSTDSSGTDSSGTDTSGTDSSGSDSSGTDTSGTDSSGTDTSGTDSSGTDSSGTDTSGTDTSGTDTSGTDTSGTDTSGTDSSGTDTSGTDTSGTDTSGTDTSGTDSSGTDSSGTDTSGTDTSGADTSGTDSSSNDSSGSDTSGTDSSGTDSSAVDDSNNTVNLYSTNSGTIYGGYTDSGNASNNTVNLYSGTFENIYGGYAPNGETSNNTLNVYNKNISAQNLSNFSAMNFYIPNDASNGDTMLNLTDSAATDLSGVAIRAGVVAGNENLAVGDTINLLTNSNGFKTDSATSYGSLTEGVSLDYGLTVSNGGSNILATIDSVPQKLNSVTQEIPLGGGLTSIKTVDAILDNNNLPDIGLDFDFESDSDDDSSAAEISDVTVSEPKGWEIFASAGGGSLKTKAGAGAYVDMKFSSFDVGFARTLENGGAGKLVFAPIIDYAHGNYDSYLADGTHGSGSTKYIAGGGVFRNMWDNGFYVEGSFRAGKVRNDFASNDMDKTFGQRVSYDTKATAMAGHLKLGRNIRLNRNNLLDVYATYYHAHQGGMNADLNPYGDKYRISSANSGRFKIGYRMTTRTSKISRIYTGLAYQYEHTSGITANYLSKNLSTASAGNSGSSGMLEIGWQIKPLRNNPWTVDINATGWVGHQRGVTAMAKVQKTF